MIIWTSSWFTKLPPEIVKIGVSRGVPRRYPPGFRRMRQLEPGSWFRSVSVEEYRRRYFGEILADLKPEAVVREIERLADGRDCALLCWEAPTDGLRWCHRGYISAWLHDALGMQVFEYGMADRGCGWSHPKLPHAYRKAELDMAPLDKSKS